MNFSLEILSHEIVSKFFFVPAHSLSLRVCANAVLSLSHGPVFLMRFLFHSRADVRMGEAAYAARVPFVRVLIRFSHSRSDSPILSVEYIVALFVLMLFLAHYRGPVCTHVHLSHCRAEACAARVAEAKSFAIFAPSQGEILYVHATKFCDSTLDQLV